MNLPNVKDVLKIVLEKLSVFKNNLSLLIPVIIFFVSLLLFIPTQLMSSGLKKQIQKESIDNGASVLRRLKETAVSDEQLEMAEESLKVFGNDANEIILLAKQTTKRKLLIDNIFESDPNDPNKPFSQTIFYEFGERYREGIDEFIAANNGNVCPTQDELDNELENTGIDTMFQSRSLLSGRDMLYGGVSGQDNIQGLILNQICRERAESTSIFIDPWQISGYDFWDQFQYSSFEADIENCWYSQLGYWIITDIFDTIIAMNRGHESLVTAPVKRLMKITFSDNQVSLLSSNKSSGDKTVKQYEDRPQYAFITDEILKETLTGRYCDENFDVVHFKATFVIKAKDFLLFLQELCSTKEHEYIDESGQTHTFKHNQITVLDYSIKSVDKISEEHQYYRYGDENVTEVELTCEYIFNVKGYEDIMPQSVKVALFGIE